MKIINGRIFKAKLCLWLVTLKIAWKYKEKSGGFAHFNSNHATILNNISFINK